MTADTAVFRMVLGVIFMVIAIAWWCRSDCDD